MEKKMEHEMDTCFISGLTGLIFEILHEEEPLGKCTRIRDCKVGVKSFYKMLIFFDFLLSSARPHAGSLNPLVAVRMCQTAGEMCSLIGLLVGKPNDLSILWQLKTLNPIQPRIAESHRIALLREPSTLTPLTANPKPILLSSVIHNYISFHFLFYYPDITPI